MLSLLVLLWCGKETLDVVTNSAQTTPTDIYLDPYLERETCFYLNHVFITYRASFQILQVLLSRVKSGLTQEQLTEYAKAIRLSFWSTPHSCYALCIICIIELLSQHMDMLVQTSTLYLWKVSRSTIISPLHIWVEKNNRSQTWWQKSSMQCAWPPLSLYQVWDSPYIPSAEVNKKKKKGYPASIVTKLGVSTVQI